jgi:glutamate-1-semialdehyde 2,1-aminomutase
VPTASRSARWSCAFIEGGVSFHYSSLHVCSVPHHNTGQPKISNFDGGTFPLEALIALRKEIQDANQSAERYPACAGCAMLEYKQWPQKEYAIDYLGLGNWVYCNIECNYCELQTKGLAVAAQNFQPYLIADTVRDLLDRGQLSPEATVDWGGGGEPTFYKDFPLVLELLLDAGTFNYIHTNGTRNPETLQVPHPENVHIICSVDAGTPDTYRRIKARDYFARVWENLNGWKQRGARVSVKYIMKEENAGPADRFGFLEQCRRLRPDSVILDIDFDEPDSKQRVVEALAALRHALEAENHHVTFGHTGNRFTPEMEIGQRVERAYQVVRSPFPELVQIQNAIQAPEMEYRPLGRSGLHVSAVGFGTCQFQVLPELQAIDTLLAGFEAGVNLVHTAPDYGRAEELIGKALRRTRAKVIVASQGFDVPGNRLGPVVEFERLFEQTCQRFGTDRLDLFGIACIDDREAYLENVWGRHGMVEFLEKKKQEGRLGATFCTTHGSPEYIAKLARSSHFDAIMMAHNALGFHLLTSPPPDDRETENLARNSEILDLCAEQGVGVLVMKPLAGGLLTRSEAFPPRRGPLAGHAVVPADTILRGLLEDPRIASVVPGTASVSEARQNAAAGVKGRPLAGGAREALAGLLTEAQSTVCSRCGQCDETCSQQLPLANMLRSALINQHPSAIYELHKDCEYFEVYPHAELACTTCSQVTCRCPVGLRVPALLQGAHQQMREMAEQGIIPALKERQTLVYGGPEFGARLLNWHIPAEWEVARPLCLYAHVENTGSRGWYPPNGEHPAEVRLLVDVDGQPTQTLLLPRDIQPFCRHRFVFDVTPPPVAGGVGIRLTLVAQQEEFLPEAGVVIYEGQVAVHEGTVTTRDNTPTLRTPSQSVAAAGPYGVGWLTHELPATLPAGAEHRVRLRVENRGSRRWAASHPAGYSVNLLVYHNAKLLRTVDLPHDVESQATAQLEFRLSFPPEQARGIRNLRFTFVEQNTAWFEQHGVRPLQLTIPATEADRRPEYGVDWLDHNLPTAWPAGAAYQVYLRCRNTGARVWKQTDTEGRPTQLAVLINGALHRQIDLPADTLPDEEALFTFRLEAPTVVGPCTLRLALLEQQVAWFAGPGAEPLDWDLEVGPPLAGPSAEAMAISMDSNWAFWLPGECILRSRTGRPYPSVMASAKGCRLTDLEGHQWIDMAMTGGSALLGYAHPEIQAAIGAQLASSALLTLPHVLEIEVSQMLRRRTAGAEMVLFGKHGSDACTVAVRVARLHTGRRKILFSGYHGWHDWYMQHVQPGLATPSGPPELFRFPPNDLRSLEQLLADHAGDVAAVMIEPGAQAVSVDGPILDADPEFLAAVRRLCDRRGIVLIFDEIITGFRYPRGSVQQAAGVVPDLTCWGKALSGGMALSALTGKKTIMAGALSRAAYYPTFRGEMYSLAAAQAALTIYNRDDVPTAVDRIGRRLLAGIDAASREVGAAGAMIGLPIRMIYKYDEPNPSLRRLRRTLLQQELLQRGVLTFVGYMLPCLAHDDATLERVIAAYREALAVVEQVAEAGAFARHLEIPLLE